MLAAAPCAECGRRARTGLHCLSKPNRVPKLFLSEDMWSWLASLIGGPVLTGLINAYKAKLDAYNMRTAIGHRLKSSCQSLAA
jgi:hypothetical protein